MDPDLIKIRVMPPLLIVDGSNLIGTKRLHDVMSVRMVFNLIVSGTAGVVRQVRHRRNWRIYRTQCDVTRRWWQQNYPPKETLLVLSNRGGGVEGILKTFWPSWLNNMSGGLGKSPVMPHKRLHLPQSRFIALLFFFTAKVYCSIIRRSCPDFGFCLLNTIFSVTARGLSGDCQKVPDGSLCVVVS